MTPSRSGALLLALGLACSTGRRNAPDAALVDPIAVEVDAGGVVRVEGSETTWEALREAVGTAFSARPRAADWRPAAKVAVEPGSPPNSVQEMLDALTRAGVREFELVPWEKRRKR